MNRDETYIKNNGSSKYSNFFREDRSPFSKKLYGDKFGNSCGNIQPNPYSLDLSNTKPIIFFSPVQLYRHTHMVITPGRPKYFSIKFDIGKPEWSIVYIEGSQEYISFSED